jgi:hypothetical protein
MARVELTDSAVQDLEDLPIAIHRRVLAVLERLEK